MEESAIQQDLHTHVGSSIIGDDKMARRSDYATTASEAGLFASALMLVVSSIILLRTPRSSGYEISIYDAFPNYFWLLVIMSIILAECIFILSVLSKTGRKLISAMSFAVILVSNSLILFLPLARGYEIYGRADVLSQVGWTKDILMNSHIDATDLYPLDHLVTAIVSVFSQLGVNTLTMIIPQVFSLLFVLYMFVFARVALRSKRVALLGLSFATILLFNISNGQIVSQVDYAPNAQSFFLLPVILFAYIKSIEIKRRRSFSLALIAMLCGIAFFHPLTLLVIIVLMVVLQSSIVTRRSLNERTERRLRSSYSGIVFAAMFFFMWQSYATLLTKSLFKVYSALVAGGSGSELTIYSSLIHVANASIGDVFIIFLNVYGTWMVIGIVTFVCILLSSVNRNGSASDSFLSRGFLVLTAFSIAVLLLPYVFAFGRVFAYAALLSLLIIPRSMLGHKSIVKKGSGPLVPNLRKGLTCVIVCLLVAISILSLYPNPIMKNTNEEVTTGELEGTQYFFHERINHTPILEVGISQSRFFQAIYGMDYPAIGISSNATPIDHFGYDRNNSMANSYQSQRYLLITSLGREFYGEVYPEFEQEWRFSPQDFAGLESDSGVISIFDNGDLQTYFVN